MALDLRQLYPKDGDGLSGANLSGALPSLVDIVAVHDLNETLAEAWTDPKTKLNWLCDLLPHDVEVARVLAFDYDGSASAFFGDECTQYVHNLAHTLLASLQANRSLMGCTERPLIFVCHGIGGLLVKKVLADASSKTSIHNVHLYPIFISTYAILFFGTPHQSIDRDPWLELEKGQRSRLKASLLSRQRSHIPGDRHVHDIRIITDHFTHIMNNFCIYYFWEELPTNLGHSYKFIVSAASAVPVNDREKSGIYATHMDMVKFSSRQTAGYRIVCEALTRYCHDAPCVIEHRRQRAATDISRLRLNEANDLMGLSLDPVQISRTDHEGDPQIPPPRHSRYFYPPAEFSSDFVGRKNELHALHTAMFPEGPSETVHQIRFVIHGLAGCGKTRLASQFARTHRDKFLAIFTIHAATKETMKDSFSRIGKIGGLEATESAGKYWLSQIEESWLLIVDNADDPTLDFTGICPEGPRGVVLITTRNPDFRRLQTIGSLHLVGMEPNEALHLLLKRADIPQPWDECAVSTGSEIVHALDCLPLALVQAGTAVFRRICDLNSYLEFCTDYRNRYRAHCGNDYRSSEEDDLVYAAFELSLSYLRPQESIVARDAIQLLNILAFFHFEDVGVDIFIRALNNRMTALKIQQPRNSQEYLLHAIRQRVQPPIALPDFLKAPLYQGDKFRIRKALYALYSLSFINYNGKHETISIHPLVHTWARDRLGSRGRAVWSQVAINTIAQSIRLPPMDIGDDHREFRAGLLPHLDSCLAQCPPWLPYVGRFARSLLPATVILRPTLLFLIKDEVLKTAKYGYIYAERGRFEQAVEYLKKVKDVLIALRGIKSPEATMAILGLAKTLWGLGRLDEAIKLQLAVVNARKESLGPAHVQTLLAQDQLGLSYWLNGQYQEALELQEPTATAICDALGPDDDRTLEAFDNLGVTLGAWHRWEESYRLHKSVWEARARKQQTDRLLTLTSANYTAMALLDLNRLDEASKIMTMVYEERREKLGKEHPWTLWALCYLAKIQTKLKNFDTAEEMLTKGIVAGIRSLSETHLGVLMGRGLLGRVYFRQNRLEEAEKLSLPLIQQLEESRGKEHPDSVYARWKLGRLYLRQSRIDEAIYEYQTALERAVPRLTVRHPLYHKIKLELEELVHNHGGKPHADLSGWSENDGRTSPRSSTTVARQAETSFQVSELLRRKCHTTDSGSATNS